MTQRDPAEAAAAAWLAAIFECSRLGMATAARISPAARSVCPLLSVVPRMLVESA